MYNSESKNYLTIRDLLVKLFFVVLFVFLIMVFVPFPNMQPFHKDHFRDNLKSMEDAAQSYFTIARLPQKVGETAKITLEEMEEKKLVLKFTDSKDRSCNTEESYAEITKMDEEYQLKTYLKCLDNADYEIKIIGCYDFCSGLTCTIQDKPTTPTTSKKYITEYEFKRAANTTYWTAWSAWTDQYQAISDTVKREEKTLYKGRKMVTSNTAEYEYSKTTKTDNWSAWSAWTDEYKATDANTRREQRTLYQGRQATSKVVTLYEYSKTTAAVWSAWSAWSTTAQTASSTKQVETRTVDGTAVYSAWKFIREDRLYSYVSPYEKELSKYVYNGSERVRECDGCYTYITIYKYNYYTRTKTIPKITEYRYRNLVTAAKTEYTWSAETALTGWVRTGNTKTETQNTGYIYSDWALTLPSGYELYQTKNQYRYSYNTPTYKTDYAWFSESATVTTGWTKTGKSRVLTANAGYTYTDWLEKLPDGYTMYQTKKMYRYSYKKTTSKTEYMWSTKTSIAGWTRTGRTVQKEVK